MRKTQTEEELKSKLSETSETVEQLKMNFQDLEVKYLKAHNDSLKRQCESSKLNEQTLQELENKVELLKIELEQERNNANQLSRDLESVKQEKEDMKQQYFMNQDKEESLN